MASDWLDQLRTQYERAHNEGTIKAPSVPDPVYAALYPFLDSQPQPELIHRVMVEGAVEFLVVTDDRGLLIRPLEDGATVHFLGSLALGRYAESTRLAQPGLEIEAIYQHERLPGNQMTVRVPIPSPTGGRTHVPRWEREAWDQTEKLLEFLRRWAQA
jgi:hypothetical protein